MKYPQVLQKQPALGKEYPILFFSLLESYFDSASSNMKVIFNVLNELVSEPLELSIECYLKGAMNLLNHVKEGFAEARSFEVIKWLIRGLSESFQNENPLEIPKYKVKTKKHSVQYPFQERETYSVLMNLKAVAFDKELLKALIRSKSSLYLVEKTFFFQIDHQNENIKIHFELQKNVGLLNDSDLFFIEKELPKYILEEIGAKDRLWIVPSNRELLLKNFHWIMKEMKPGDLPQVFIDFSKQTSLALHFSTLICSLSFHEKDSLKQKLSHVDLQIEGSTIIKEETEIKEGIIASIEIPFHASPSPIDARKKCAQLIEGLIGPFRDINGGLLEKTEKNLFDLAAESGESIDDLKPFFYSITPQELQATAPIPLLIHSYTSLKKAKESFEQSDLLFYENQGILSICIKIKEGAFLKGFKKVINKEAFRPLFSSFETKSTTITCCTLSVSNFSEVQEIKKHVSYYYRHWLGKKEQKQVLRISSNTSFMSFDPRIGTDEETSFLHRLLFAGLMQVNTKGCVEGAIAKKVEVFDQRKHYRFHLRKSYWSDGSLLTAKDFIYSWKTTLNPKFFSLLSHFFYTIKNGRKIKEGKLSPDSLGVEAPDPLTLDVFLEYPCPYFLELCTHPVFSPILVQLDQSNPNWAEHEGNDYVCNGGFFLEKAGKDLVRLKKNPYYWDASRISLEKIEISSLSEEKCIEGFKKQQIDALLNPISKYDLSGVAAEPISKKWEETIETKYLSFNCKSPLFSNHKIRRAISHVIDRKILAQKYSLHSSPYFSPYSPYFTQLQPPESFDIESARALFEEGLQESSLSLEMIQSVQFSILPRAKKLGEALVQQINQALNLSWKVAIFSPKELKKLLSENKLDVIFYSWIDRIFNPSYFLEVFFSSTNPVNCSSWDHPRIKELIEKIRNEGDAAEKKKLHKEAEELIQEFVPIAPLFITPSYSVTQPYIVTPPETTKFSLLTAYKK